MNRKATSLKSPLLLPSSCLSSRFHTLVYVSNERDFKSFKEIRTKNLLVAQSLSIAWCHLTEFSLFAYRVQRLYTSGWDHTSSFQRSVQVVVVAVVLANGSGVLREGTKETSSACPFRLASFFAVWFVSKNDVLDVAFGVFQNSWQLGAALGLQSRCLGSPWSLHCYPDWSLPSSHDRTWQAMVKQVDDDNFPVITKLTRAKLSVPSRRTVPSHCASNRA